MRASRANLVAILWMLMFFGVSIGYAGLRGAIATLCVYIVFATGCFAANRISHGSKNSLHIISAILTIVYVIFSVYAADRIKLGQIFGLSYLYFRLIWYTIEYHSRSETNSQYFQYLTYIFNPLVFISGPIITYTKHCESISKINFGLKTVFANATENSYRIFFGLLKMLVLAPMFLLMNPDQYIMVPGILFFDSLLKAFALYGFLYCNFSGYCDLVIAFGKVIGYDIPENFNRPYLSSSMREFWTRWHMTLGVILRRLIFEPAAVNASRAGVPIIFATALAIFLSFFLMGLWHGPKLNYIYFGLFHGVYCALELIFSKYCRVAICVGDTTKTLFTNLMFALSLLIFFN